LGYIDAKLGGSSRHALLFTDIKLLTTFQELSLNIIT